MTPPNARAGPRALPRAWPAARPGAAAEEPRAPRPPWLRNGHGAAAPRMRRRGPTDGGGAGLGASSRREEPGSATRAAGDASRLLLYPVPPAEGARVPRNGRAARVGAGASC